MKDKLQNLGEKILGNLETNLKQSADNEINKTKPQIKSMDAAGKYYFEQNEYGYQTLYSPTNNELTTLTEPEDRNFYRDLAPVLEELNKLYKKTLLK